MRAWNIVLRGCCNEGKRKVTGSCYEVRSCGHSFPDFLAFWACKTLRRWSATVWTAISYLSANTRYSISQLNGLGRPVGEKRWRLGPMGIFSELVHLSSSDSFPKWKITRFKRVSKSGQLSIESNASAVAPHWIEIMTLQWAISWGRWYPKYLTKNNHHFFVNAPDLALSRLISTRNGFCFYYSREVKVNLVSYRISNTALDYVYNETRFQGALVYNEPNF